jgi:hypothetical protein
MINTAKFPLYIIALSLYFILIGSVLYSMMIEPAFMVIYIYGIITMTIILVLSIIGIVFSDVEW